MRLYELAGNNPKSKTAIFTFGRFQPPTIGHQVLIDRVKSIANELGADYFIFLSQKQKAPTDPLPWYEKVYLFKAAFPGTEVWEDTVIRTPYEALEALGEDYDEVIMVVGSDRVETFKQGMSKYLEDFGIEKFDVVSAGERDPDAEGTTGMSASKARELASQGNYEEFSLSLPDTMSEAKKKKTYDLIRNNL